MAEVTIGEQNLDTDLLKKIARKDGSALSVFYDRHAPRLYGLALKILREEGLAQDVLQDLFLFLWQNADRFTARRGSPLGWLMVLCRNRCIDQLRQKKRKQQQAVLFSEETLQAADLDESESPLDFVHHRDIQATLARAVKALPEDQRVCIELAYYGGLSQSEISEKLDVPLGTVKTRIRLGMQKLRDQISDLTK